MANRTRDIPGFDGKTPGHSGGDKDPTFIYR